MSSQWQRAQGAGRAWPQAAVALLLWAVLAGTWAGLLALPARVLAQNPAQEADATLDATRLSLDKIGRQMNADNLPDADLSSLRKTLLGLQQGAEQIATTQAPELASAQARLAELGPAPADGAGAEASDVAKQRRSVAQAVSELDARVKLARLLAVESEQLADKAGDLARDRFQAQLFERTDSLLSRGYWQELRLGLARDGARLQGLLSQLGAAAAATPGWTALGLLALVGGVLLLRLGLLRLLMRFEREQVPHGRVRRSTFALASALMAMLVPGTLAFALTLALDGGPEASAGLHSFFGKLIGAACFSAYLSGICHAVLSPRRPSWRMLPMPVPDSVAHGLRYYPLWLGLLTFCGWLAQQLAGLVQSGLATVVAINSAYTLLLGLLLAVALRRGKVLHRQAVMRAQKGEASEPVLPPPLWLTLGAGLLWLILSLSLLGMLVGYVALGAFVIRQIAWVLLLAVTAYVLTAVIDDTANDWLVPRAAQQQAQALGERDGAAAQTGGRQLQLALLFSAALRLTVVLLALALVAAPFGEGPQELIKRTGQLAAGVTVGELQLNPTAVLQAVLVFLLANMVVRALKRWTAEHFLPATSLDAGMRTSVTTLLGFLGMVVATALALSAVGLALDKVAWIASALSVGIGFGLQAVVSNFVSGLILLAEQPVKVGDWVALGGVEGDIRRISVRATEIEMGDRSTVIVPNSEFITKVVRNVTRNSPLGLVQIKLPMPLSSTDPDKVTDLLLEAFVAHPDVLETPEPTVFLDNIADGSLVFNATGFVHSPRAAYKTRSALLYTVLKRLREEGQPIWKAPSLVLRDGSSALDGPAPLDPGIQTRVRGTPETPG